jgi:DNA modification methylase
LARGKRRIKAAINASGAKPLAVDVRPIASLKTNPRNARTHSKKQIRQIADSIVAFGFVVPLVVDESSTILLGHGRLAAAILLGLSKVPVIVLEGLSEAKKRALLLADNKIADNAGWNRQLLAVELPELAELLIDEDLDISITGFEPVEIDQIATDFEEDTSDPADTIESEWLAGSVVSKLGDIWKLGEHRLSCGDARDAGDIDRLMSGKRAAMVFLDPPYDVQIRSIVGRGRIKHAEFAMASGEMSPSEFTAFLEETLGNAARVSHNGAIHYVCMGWRHVAELIEAGREVYNAMLNLAVWVKSNAGQGSFYRSQHELICVFRVGNAPHLNNVELGRHGRSRSNVWHYAGVNSFRARRMDELAAHPTVKPVTMVADAMKDCTRRGDIVLDTFAGAGTTILAAERVGRRAYSLELEPKYVDVAIRRWQAFTRSDALHADTVRTFAEMAGDRKDAQLASFASKSVCTRRRAKQ